MIYVDELFLLSLLVDYLLCLMTARFCGLVLRRARYLLAALLGAVYAVLVFLPGLQWAAQPAVSLCAAAGMGLVAFGGERRLLRCCAAFLAVSASLGGLVWAIALRAGSMRPPDGRLLLGGFALSDTLRPTSAEAVQRLNALGVKTVMLTGDNDRAARAIGGQLGVSEVRAQLLPQDKQDVIADLQAQGRRVMMVGDGINDAPALVKADLGAAVGQGTDVAIESADVVLMRDDPRLAAGVIRLGRAVIRNIKENLFWAFFYNLIGIPIAAGALSGLGVELNPMIAAAAMSMSSVCVVTNALRLRRFRLDLPDVDDDAGAEAGELAIVHTDLPTRTAGPAARPSQQTNDKEEKTMKKTVKIEGMMCQMCVKHVKAALSALDPDAEVSLENKCASIDAAVADEAIAAAVKEAGYEVVG